MKTVVCNLLLLFAFSPLMNNVTAQTNYSFPISTILNAGATGIRLPNGTIVKATRVATGTGTHSAASGTSDPNGMGGVFTGTSFLPQYVGSTVRESFTVIETNNTFNVDGGINNNCQNGIGFRIFFDRPTIKISFLALDIDGNNTNPGNAEWITSFAFNGTTFVPYDQIVEGTLTVANVDVTIGAGSTWRTLITNTAGATAATNLPSPYPIKRAGGGGIPPDALLGQVIFTPNVPTAAITDFFVLWGVYQVPAASGSQASGLSPIVVRVSPDFGDAPDTYKTLLISGGPSHGVVGTVGLGAINNTKPDGTPSVAANLDPDDDGIASVPILTNTGSLSQIIPVYTLTSNFFNSTGLAANYVAWIDWNNDGIFQASEAQTATTAAGTTTGAVIFTWTNVTLSGTAGRANTYARIRTTTEAITTADMGGAFRDGEVEDYLVPFATVLPLTLTAFSGKIESDHVILNWKTENENNVAGFEIQLGNDGINFSTAGYINAAGNVNNNYSFNDPRMVQRVNYYRLKITDKDGRITYSSTIILRNAPGNNIELKVSPNPVTSVLNLNIAYAEPLTISIYNVKGQLVKQEKPASSNYITIDCSSLAGGSYYVKVINDEGKMETVQFLKQ